MAFSPLSRSAITLLPTYNISPLLHCHTMHLHLAVHDFCSCCHLSSPGTFLSAPAASWSFHCTACQLKPCQIAHCTGCACDQHHSQVVDAANVLIQDDKRVGTILLVMAKHGIMEWVPAKQNLRPVSLAAGGVFCHIVSRILCCVSDRDSDANQSLITDRRGSGYCVHVAAPVSIVRAIGSYWCISKILPAFFVNQQCFAYINFCLISDNNAGSKHDVDCKGVPYAALLQLAVS